MSKSYLIDLAEYQREILIKAMKAIIQADTLDKEPPVNPPTASFMPYDTEYAEAEVLLGMLEELPEVERETPGVMHGFAV